MTAVVVQGLHKTYAAGQTPALAGVSFEVAPGELFGLIGPDGAGKTTLLRILATLLLADAGHASVLDMDVVRDFRRIRRTVGYMPGRFSLYQDLSVEENLQFFATVFGTTVEENYSLIEDIYVQLEPFKRRLSGALSGGMKQKLALCCALIHAPRILLLDEPTTGVDPVSRKDFWDMLARLRARGITILVSTPYMDEAARCDRVALVQAGRFIALDSLAGLLAAHDTPTYAVHAQDRARALRDLRGYAGTRYCFGFGQVSHLTLKPEAKDPAAAADFLRAHGHTAARVERIKPNIEDVYIELTQELGHD